MKYWRIGNAKIHIGKKLKRSVQSQCAAGDYVEKIEQQIKSVKNYCSSAIKFISATSSKTERTCVGCVNVKRLESTLIK